MGLSVVSHTLCKMVVLPAFALPIIRTRNWISGIRGRGCCVSIGATVFRKKRVVDRSDPVPDRWFARSSWFTFLICRPLVTESKESSSSHQSCNQAQASQRLNHVVECIRNVPKDFGDISPDYPVGRTTGVLFLRFLRLTYSSHRGLSIIGSQLEISSSPPGVHPPAHRTSGPGLQPQHTAPHM